jgi:hypothetical protein
MNLQRCIIEDLDLSGVKQLTSAHLSNVTFTRVVFKGASLLVRTAAAAAATGVYRRCMGSFPQCAFQAIS